MESKFINLIVLFHYGYWQFQSLIQILIQNLVNQPLTPDKGLVGYAQQDVSLTDLQITIIRVSELTDFLDA